MVPQCHVDRQTPKIINWPIESVKCELQSANQGVHCAVMHFACEICPVCNNHRHHQDLPTFTVGLGNFRYRHAPLLMDAFFKRIFSPASIRTNVRYSKDRLIRIS